MKTTPTLPRARSNRRAFPDRFPFHFLVLALPLLFVVLAPNLRAQTNSATIEGRVQNAASGDYLSSVRIRVDGSDRETFTDATGFYRLSGLPSGGARLRVSYTGQPDQEVVVQLAPGQAVRQDITLIGAADGSPSQAIRLDAFTVAVTREMNAESLAINEQRYATNTKNVIAADAFGDVSEGNVGEFIKRLPGVSIDEAAGDAYSISLRGFSPEFTPISVDGNTIPSASFSATSVSRGSNLEQVSMSNVSRIEVVKSPIPSVPADFLGGSVNLISKSAFERSRPQLTVRGTLQFTSDDYELTKSPGPGSPQTRKLRPGYEFSYVNPVSENFGFTLSSMRSDQFGKLLGPIRTFEFAPAQGGSETAPYLRAFRTTDDARETVRHSYAGSADWRPIRALTLSVSARHTIYDLFTAPQRMTFNTGNNPVSFSADHTAGRTGAGSVVHSQIWTTKFGDTDSFTFSGRYREGLWKGDFSTAYSNSGNKYRDVGRGFFRGVTTQLIPAPTIRWEGFSGTDMPRTFELRNAAGSSVDWTRLDAYRVVNVLSVQRDATDELTSGNINLRREITVGRMQGGIQVGAAYRKRTVDRGATDVTRNFVGADGVAATADDSAGPFVDASYLGVDQKFGVTQRNVQWPDLRALHRLYQERPGYFVTTAAQATAAYVFEAQNSERISEEISAAYVQGELSLLRNRLKILGGVRFERTANRGIGLLRDRNAVYQRDAAGRIVRNANGTPVFISTDTLVRARLEYLPRRSVSTRSYDDYYPSINASYGVTDDLLFRVSYARTLGRPNYNNVVANLDVIEDLDGTTGRIVARNPSLNPWEADNFEASLEYYFKSSGVVSIGAFRKDVAKGFGTATVVLDPQLLTQFDLDARYAGWELQSTFNLGSKVRITGMELNYQQKLTFLPAWARGVSAFANTTILDIDGPDTAFSTLYDRTANWGLSYSRGRLGVGFNWNYFSSKSTPLTLGGAAGARFNHSRLTLDATSEFRFTPRISFFLNARNLTNTLDKQERALPRSPDYSRAYAYTERGVKMSAGIRGVF